MFGYACDETTELMPAPVMYHRLGRKLTDLRKAGKANGPRRQGQISVIVNDKPKKVTSIVVSTQHRCLQQDYGTSSQQVITKVIPKRMLAKTLKSSLTHGRFVVGGPRGRRTYGTQNHCRHLRRQGRHEAAFSGKDPSKVDRRRLHGTLC